MSTAGVIAKMPAKAIEPKRGEAFKIILHDIEQNPTLYTTSEDQRQRLGALATKHELKFTKLNTNEVTTPDAGQWWDYLRDFAAKKTKKPQARAKVFQDGSKVLDEDQIQGLHQHRPDLKLQASIKADDPTTTSSQEPRKEVHESQVANDTTVVPAAGSASPQKPAAKPQDQSSPSEYCYCKKDIEDADMVACDNKSCGVQWFHLACTDLDALPAAQDSWLCRDCRATSEQPPVPGTPMAGEMGGQATKEKRKSTAAFGAEEDATSGLTPNKRQKTAADGVAEPMNDPSIASASELDRDRAINAKRASSVAFGAEEGVDTDIPASKRQKRVSATEEEALNGSQGHGTKRKAETAAEKEVAKRQKIDAVSPEEKDTPDGALGRKSKQKSTAGAGTQHLKQQRTEAPKTTQESAGDKDAQSAPQHMQRSGTNAQPQAPATSPVAAVTNGQPVTEAHGSGLAGKAKYPYGLRAVEDISGKVYSIQQGLQYEATEFMEGFGMGDGKKVPVQFVDHPKPALKQLYETVFCKGSKPWTEQAVQVTALGVDMRRVLTACMGADLFNEVFSKPVPWTTPQQALEMLKPQHSALQGIMHELFWSPEKGRNMLGTVGLLLFQAGQNVIDDEAFIKDTIEPIAEKHASRLLLNLMDQLKAISPNLTVHNGPPMEFWAARTEAFKALFVEALSLRGKLEAAPYDIEFFWVEPGTRVEAKWHQDACGHGVDEALMCVMPGIKFERDNGQWGDLSKARVFGRKLK